MTAKRPALRYFLMLLACQCFSIAGWGQIETAAPPAATASSDNLRLLFDSRGGFKLFHFDTSDNSYHPLLNPAVDAPVNLDIWRNGTLLPLKLSESNPAAQPGDPGFRGPSFTADDIAIQLWGLDLSSSESSWAAVRYEFTNTGNAITTLSIRFILDTFLGESGREPLALYLASDGQKSVITDETQQKIDEQLRVVASSKPDNSDSLFILLPARGWPNQTPQRMIAANVRRLQNSGSGFEVEDHRAFNLLPFSINDSAIALLHDSEVMLPRQRIAIDILVSPRLEMDQVRLGRVKDRLEAIKVTHVPEAELTTTAANPTLSESRAQLISRINRMLAELNAIMDSGKYKQGDIENMIQAIDDAQKQLQKKP